MVPRLVRKIFGLPFRFVRRALQLWTPSQPEILPVGGLTPEASSELLFALRQAATTAEVLTTIHAVLTITMNLAVLRAVSDLTDEREKHDAAVHAG